MRRIAVVAEDPSRHNVNSLANGTSIHPRDELDAVQRELRETGGVSVLIFDQTCAAEKRRRRKRGDYPAPAKRLFINDRVCEGCGDCSAQSNCMSIEPLETPFGTKRQINQSSCNMDFSCAKGFCPSFIEVEGAAVKKPDIAPETIIAAAADLPAPVLSADEREVKILLTGIGGMGVTTVSSILAMAAHLDGRQAASLDMTGLAQKGGAVVSHLAIAPAGAPSPIARITPGGADCIIAGDLVVAASAESLAICNSQRTVAIADEDIAPTAEFTLHGTQGYKTSRPQIRIGQAVSALSIRPAGHIAEMLFGDKIYANMILAGLAFQQGCLPLSLNAIEEAIKLNGASVETNLAAFHAGRVIHAKPDAFAGPASTASALESESIDDLTGRFARELTAYQNDAYALRFRRLVARARLAETTIHGGASQHLPLTEAVAQSFFKLMAYKDEYEVARLYSDPDFKARLRAAFDGKPRLKVLLAPPLLARTDPATSRPKKMAFGPWIFPVFAVLAKLKILRGTALDPFGWTSERRMERALIARYESMIETVLPQLSHRNIEAAIEIAALPEQISGYGPVKSERIAKALNEEQILLAKFRDQAAREQSTASPQMMAAE